MRRLWPLVSVVALAACGADDTNNNPSDAGTDPLAPGAYQTCAVDQRVGGIAIALQDGFTSVQGAITDGVRPVDVPAVEMSEGECELWRPMALFCDPGCTGQTTCNDQGVCVALPTNQSVGTLTFEGLTADIEIEARPPVYFYNFIGDLPHPAFSALDVVRMRASGDGVAPFELVTKGVEPLVVTTASVALRRAQPAVVEWAASPADPSIRLALELNIANHGGTPGRVVCEVEDTGRFEIPAALVTALLDGGFSGFPTVTLTRQGVASTETGFGCVELALQSEVLVEVDIPGLTSCSDSSDCPTGQSCQPDLTCG